MIGTIFTKNSTYYQNRDNWICLEIPEDLFSEPGDISKMVGNVTVRGKQKYLAALLFLKWKNIF
ncbi:hypothetical protein HW35_04055 [Bacillus sp. X1(2014)]|nr:hypothetical protein HW35_04055 [Bacillus sp. X1(2014)]